MSIKTSLTEKEIEFCEHFYSPCSLIENLIPVNINTPQIWPRCDTMYVRDYQQTMLNYSYMYADDPKLSKKENFRIKKLVGDCYMIGARGIGKSFMLIIDCVLSIIHNFKEITVASCSNEKLVKVTNPIASFVDSHKFLKIFHLKDSRKKSVNRDPLEITSEIGCKVYGVNEQSDTSVDAGKEFHGKHSTIRFYEEKSYSSAEGEIKAVDAVDHEIGCIERPSGIPDLCVGSPLGKIIDNPKMKPWIWRLPMMVMQSWDEKMEQDRIEFYKGRNSAQFRLNVLAEVIEGAFGYWDMARLRESSLNMKKQIKFFEIGKDEYHTFEQRLIIERMSGATQCFISLDEGYGAAPTEINIIFYDGKKYKYVYNICLFRLTNIEQEKIIKWIYDKLGTAFIASDCTGGSGTLIELLFKDGVPEDHLHIVKFTENIEVGFEYIDNDPEKDILLDRNGNPIMKQEYCMDFAEKELQRLIYTEQLEVPIDEKFLNQFTNRFVKKVGTKTLYKSKGEDHLYASFLVWAISRFFNEFKILKNKSQAKVCLGIFNSERK